MSDQQIDGLAALWRWFAADQFHGYSPIYERIALTVADDRELLAMICEAPPEAHLPLATFGAVRYLLLDGVDHPLAEVYDGRSDADPGPLFVDFCRGHRNELLDVLQVRRVQTNDCGRSALIGPALTWVSRRLPAPYALVDVGTSAGINLLCDRFRLDYGEAGATGPADSPVVVECEVRGGPAPIAGRLPELVDRVGIDLSPIDLADPADARWLIACVWPDTGRAARVAASIRLAQEDLPRIVAGRANDVLPGVLRTLPDDTTAIVMTTWAFGYFSLDERTEFVDLLRAAARRRPVVWLSADNPGVVAGLPGAVAATDDLLGAIVFDRGTETADVLAEVHHHGNWLRWFDDAPTPISGHFGAAGAPN